MQKGVIKIKIINFKIIFSVAIIISIFITTIFASTTIKSAEISNAKVKLDYGEINLNNPLVSILNNGEKDAKLYMPVRELLEYMGYTVKWNSKFNTVVINSGTTTGSLWSGKNQKEIEYKNIDVNIQDTKDVFKAGKDTPFPDYYYYYYGPYHADNFNEKVSFDISNGVSQNLFIATSANKEVNEMCINIFTTIPKFNGRIDIVDNNDRSYYVIIGSKDIKNLKGSFSIPVYK